MSCTPETVFDKVSKAMASSVTRRDAFKYVSAAALGAMLTGVGVRQAYAKKISCQFSPACPPTICQNNPGNICFCSLKVKNGIPNPAKTKCVDDLFCSGIQSCNSRKDCPSGSICGTTACCGGIGCLTKCNQGPPCCSAQGGASAAAA